MATKFFCLVVTVAIFVFVSRNTEAKVTQNPALLGVTYIGPAPHYNCTANGAFPHETDCEYFYDCWDGLATLGLCTQLQLYDLRWKGCDNAELVDCGDRVRPTGYPGTVTPPMTEGPTEPTEDPGTGPTTTTTTTPGPPINFTCPEPNGVFANLDRCDYYWVCYNSLPLLNRCPTDSKFLYDLRYKGCNFPEDTDCGTRERPPGYPEFVTSPPTTTTTGRPVPDFDCPPGEEDGNHPDPQDCASFFYCVAGTPFHFKCPGDLYYNPETRDCDYKDNVECHV